MSLLRRLVALALALTVVPPVCGEVPPNVVDRELGDPASCLSIRLVSLPYYVGDTIVLEATVRNTSTGPLSLTDPRTLFVDIDGEPPAVNAAYINKSPHTELIAVTTKPDPVVTFDAQGRVLLDGAAAPSRKIHQFEKRGISRWALPDAWQSSPPTARSRARPRRDRVRNFRPRPPTKAW